MVRLDDARALVQTVDFFTPIVDDPRTFGAIAAANALSDVWAMGGEPLSALNIVCFPEGRLPLEVLEQILAGGCEKLDEADTVLAGGHSVRDDELKYGMAITGLVHPDRIWTNGGARPGDVLLLTKPLGTGVLSTAVKRGALSHADIGEAVQSMLRLNREAKRAAEKGTVHACTDVTGYGLAGHGLEVARASGVALRIRWSAVPLLPGAAEAARAGHVPGGTRANLDHLGAHLVAPDLDGSELALLADPQTSGGLLLAIPKNEQQALVERLRAAGQLAAVIGEVLEGPPEVRVIRGG